MKRATLHDVAKLAGVSSGTVSKYINGEKVSPKNGERVRRAVDVLNYMPNPLARSFAKGKTFSILLYIMVETPIVASTWLHELPIIQGISDVIKNTEYNLRIEIASREDENENCRHVEMYIRSKFADAIVLLSPWMIPPKMQLILDYHAFPYVMIGRSASASPRNEIDFDNYSPVHEITLRMYERGCRSMALIGGFATQRHMRMREEGFRSALKELGLPLKPEFVKYGDYSLQSGYDLALEVLAGPEKPDAIVCGNDYIASGAIQAIKNRNLRVPEDIAVCGFDDTIVSDATEPRITTVCVPSYQIGRIAAEELMERLKNPAHEIKSKVVRCLVRYKESTGRTITGEQQK